MLTGRADRADGIPKIELVLSAMGRELYHKINQKCGRFKERSSVVTCDTPIWIGDQHQKVVQIQDRVRENSIACTLTKQRYSPRLYYYSASYMYDESLEG